MKGYEIGLKVMMSNGRRSGRILYGGIAHGMWLANSRLRELVVQIAHEVDKMPCVCDMKISSAIILPNSFPSH